MNLDKTLKAGGLATVGLFALTSCFNGETEMTFTEEGTVDIVNTIKFPAGDWHPPASEQQTDDIDTEEDYSGVPTEEELYQSFTMPSVSDCEGSVSIDDLMEGGSYGSYSSGTYSSLEREYDYSYSSNEGATCIITVKDVDVNNFAEVQEALVFFGEGDDFFVDHNTDAGVYNVSYDIEADDREHWLENFDLLPENYQPELSLTMSFPGEIIDYNVGDVDNIDNTITFDRDDIRNGFEVQAEDTAPSFNWVLYVGLPVFVLLLVAAISGFVISRKKNTSTTPQSSPQQAYNAVPSPPPGVSSTNSKDLPDGNTDSNKPSN